LISITALKNKRAEIPASPIPDVMLHFGLVPFDWNTVPLGYPTAQHGFSMTPNVPRATREDVVGLRSADPKDAPVIDFRYFSIKREKRTNQLA
jgi:choline oxidase